MDWITDNLNGLAPILVLLGTGIGALIYRWMSGQAHVEDEESLERTIRIKQLMDAEGLSVDDVRHLRTSFRQGSGSLLSAEARAVVDKQVEAERKVTALYEADDQFGTGPVAFEDTTVGMNAKAGAEIDVLNGQLQLAVAKLAHGLSDLRTKQLYEAQDAWEAYRHADADYAALLFEGGTGASLLGASRIIELSEQRLRDLALYEAEKHL